MRIFRRTLPLLLAIMVSTPIGVGPFAAGPCGPPIVNAVACENSRAGNPQSEWDIVGSGDASIQGFSTDMSVNRGATVLFKINTPATAYRLDIYRLGYYAGLGARRVATILPSASLPQSQPACLTQAATGLIDCGNWSVSASWAVPADAVSGVYIARLVRTDTSGASHIVFIVRDDAGTSDVLFQTSDETWQAYNSYGGNSLYVGNAPVGRAYKVSYNRPFVTRANANGLGQRSFLFDSEYPMIRWLESNGYDVSYFTGMDTDRNGGLIQRHKMFMSVGHDEYWSGPQRANVEAARAAGVNLAFFSGNEIFWKTRWESSIDASGTPYRTLVSYKETRNNAPLDPSDPPTWTGTWRDPRFSPPGDGGRPENSLTGTIFMVNGPRTDTITVPAAEGAMRFWRNTSVATLTSGQVATLAAGTLGHEWDEDLDNGSRPEGVVRLSSTTVSVQYNYLLDYGAQYGAGTPTHRMTLYKYGGRALVFGAGTTRWSWGLDATHDSGVSTPDVRMQQATANLLADMGVLPTTLQTGLIFPATSTDATAPTTNITSPANGANVAPGTPITITGTAADVGGVVGAVEVSVDNGRTWHLATGRETWSYGWTPGAAGSVVNVMSRAVDDSANIGATRIATVTVGSCGVCRSSFAPGTAGGYAEAPHAAELNTTGDWTIEVWMKDESVGGYNHGTTYIAIKGDTNQNGEAPYLLGVQWNSLFAGGRTAYANNVMTASLLGVSANAWHHVAASFVAATRQTTLYLDGAQVAQGVLPNASTRGNMLPVSIGRNGTTGMYWTGKLDDLRIWNVARTGAQIGANYRTELTAAPATLVANWKFNEGNGTVAADSAGAVHLHDATLRGGAGWSTDVGNTPPAPDTTPPVITAVSATAITTTTATIVWSTDEGADSQVDYGTTTGYGSTTPLNGALVTSHSQGLSGLASNTTYHYRVKSKDAAGNPATSGDFTFNTAAPDTTPPVITAVAASGMTTTAATIGWTTNEPADTQVDYGTTTSYGSSSALNPTLVTSHSQGLTGLSANTTYHYRVKSKDAAGNPATSGDFTFNTAAPDTTPPVITAVAATGVTNTAASIGWTTSEPSDTQVEYGTTTGYGSSSALNPTLVTSHSQGLTGLSANTTYHYRVKSKDAAGNPATSGDFTFTTTNAPPLASLSLTAGGYAEAPNATELNITGDWTVEAWFKDESVTGGYNHDFSYIVMKGNTNSNAEAPYLLGVQWNNLFAGERTGWTTYTVQAPLTGVSFMAWHHAAASFVAATRQLTLYLDGVQVAQGVLPARSASGNALPVQIGRNGSGSNLWPGKIDDVRIWNVARTGAEIASGYAAELGSAPAALVGNWKFNESTGLTAADGGGTPQDATLMAGATWSTDVGNIPAAPDTTPPVISGVGASAITTTGATIGWITNESADTQVEYGATTTYGSSTLLNGALVTTHSQSLGGLVANTQYHYRVLSRDAAGNPAASADFTFTTAAPDTTPPLISSVGASGITMTGATIGWITNEPADGQVEYGTTTAYGSLSPLNGSLATGHSQALGGLVANTRYHFRVLSKDAAGNPATSGDFTFDTVAPDTTPPLISGVVASGITNVAATISWNTDEPADSQVEYGTTTAYGATTALVGTLVTAHTQGVSGLAANTTYHYRVRSTDAAGNPQASADFSFITTNTPALNSLALTTGASAEAPNATELNVTGDWTIEAWFKDENPAGTFNHDFAYIAMKGNTNANAEAPFVLGVQWNNVFAGSRTGWTTYTVQAPLGGVNMAAWHHVAASFVASTRQLTLYLDGVQVAQGILAARSVAGNALPVAIGRNGSGANPWTGKIDDLRLWNVSRTAAQISASYQAELGSAPAGLVGNWKFNEGSGTIAADSTATPQDATLMNGAGWSGDVHP